LLALEGLQADQAAEIKRIATAVRSGRFLEGKDWSNWIAD